MISNLTFAGLMGDDAGTMAEAMRAGRRFLKETPEQVLLQKLGETVSGVPEGHFPDKRWFQRSFSRSVTAAPDDMMVGRGLFYLTEQRSLCLDCTAGHYQMTWGYEHPELTALLRDGIQRGIVWDNHSNIPVAPVKVLARKLVQIANPGVDLDALGADGNRLNTALLGVVTGSVACAAALKIMILHHKSEKEQSRPVFVVLDGNYHGTDVLAQRLRGMWEDVVCGVEVATVEPNDPEQLEHTFAQYGERIAGFWAEPIMMNREAIVVEPAYLRLARRLCDEVGALMAIDEIQTGFWYPEIMCFKRYGIEPDFVVLGKGMTAGFHPLSALLYKGKLDLLAQYDAISTNGNAALAAYMALGCIALIEREAAAIGRVGLSYHEQLARLAAQFPDLVAETRGCGHMSALKFRRREDALGFHNAALERGLWLRAHAYHAGHSTVLTKFALPLNEDTASYAVGQFRLLLEQQPWRR